MEWKNPKIKHSALSNSYMGGGLKRVDVFTKIISHMAINKKGHMMKVSMNGK